MAPQSPPRLTLAQLLALPIYAAVAFACITLLDRAVGLRSFGLVGAIAFEAVVIPVALAFTALVLHRPTRRRDRAVVALVSASATVLLVALLASMVGSLYDIGAAIATGQGFAIDLVAFEILRAGAVIALWSALAALRRRLRPGHCPSCGRPDDSADDGEDDTPRSRPGPRARCDRCGDGRRADRDEAPPTDLARSAACPPVGEG